MCRASTIFLFLVMAFKVAVGVPAYPYPVEITQPDGSRMVIFVRGDERCRYKTNILGDLVERGDDGFYRPSFNRYGHEIAQVAKSSINTISKGKISALIIPVDFKDVKFTVSDPKEHFDKMVNQKGYAENNATGSVKDYFEENLKGLREVSFSVSDVVHLSQNLAYYGKNVKSVTNVTYDVNLKTMMREACAMVNPEVDFSRYLYVFLYFAGYSEAEGGDENSIWPVSMDISSDPITLDGAYITAFGCASELRGASGTFPSGIGAFCHEFGHVLGLPDLYDVDYQEGGQANGMWGSLSLMDYGCYNNQGRTPPYFNAIERELLGVKGESLPKQTGIYLEPVHINQKFYRVDTSTEGEYFLIESRSEQKWDAYIGGEGMLVYHIDKSSSPAGGIVSSVRWNVNLVNAFAEHQCADLVEASSEAVNVRQVFFPGLANVTEFAVLTDPHFVDWKMRGTGLKFENITLVSESEGVSFDVRPDNDEILLTAANIKVVPNQNDALITWDADYDMEANWKLRWKKADAKFSSMDEVVSNGRRYELLNLKGGTSYDVQLFHLGNKNTGDTVSFRFRTQDITSPYPYIHGLENGVKVGDTLKLSLYNLIEMEEEIRWILDGREVRDGVFVIDEPGFHMVEVKIRYLNDGSIETISCEIYVKEEEVEDEMV